MFRQGQIGVLGLAPLNVEKNVLIFRTTTHCYSAGKKGPENLLASPFSSCTCQKEEVWRFVHIMEVDNTGM